MNKNSMKKGGKNVGFIENVFVLKYIAYNNVILKKKRVIYKEKYI